MDRVTEITFGQTGQTFTTYPPEWAEGVPSSATCAVYGGTTSLDNAADFSPTVTIDAVSTTVDQASGYSQTNRRTLYVASTSGISTSTLYLLSNGSGQRELVTPIKVATDDYVTVEQDLAYDYTATATSTFKGVRLSAPVDATWVANEANINGGPAQITAATLTQYDIFGNYSVQGRRTSYKVVWSYTVASIARRHYTYLRLVRQKPHHNVTLRDLMKYWPDIAEDEEAEVRGQQFRYAIDAAWDRVRADLVTEGYRPEQIRDTELIDQLVIRAALQVVAMSGKAPPARDVEAWIVERTQDYRSLFGRAISTLKADIDQGAEGAVTVTPFKPLWFRR